MSLTSWERSRLLHREAAFLLSDLDNTTDAYKTARNALVNAFEKGYERGKSEVQKQSSDSGTVRSGGVGEEHRQSANPERV